MTPKEQLNAFITGESPSVIVSPLFSEELPKRLSGADWHISQNDPAMIEAKLDVGARGGFPPIVKMEIGSLGFLEPIREVLEDTGDKQTVRIAWPSPDRKPLESVIEVGPNGTHAVSKMINTIDDTLRVVTAWEQLGDWETFQERLAEVVTRVGDRGLVCFNIGHPFGSHDDHVTSIFFAMEHAAAMRQATRRMCAVKKRQMEAAAAAGVRCFFAGALGSNMYSPAMVDEWMVPYCIELREQAHRLGAIYYLHECGSMKHKLKRGVYHRILPDWLEGFEAPPLGDIENLAEVRRQLPPSIVFKGNFNLEFLKDATPDEVVGRTRQLLMGVAGYRHIVGGACSLLQDTPIENLQAMVEATTALQASATGGIQ